MRYDAPKIQFAFLSALALGTGIVNAMATTPLRGALAGGFLFAIAAALYFGRDRFDLLNVLSGSGDERTRALYTRASAFTGNVLATVITVWWVATGVFGDEVNETLTVLTAVGAAAFVLGAVVASRRS